MFGDQTDVPESGDWWDAGYLIMWGSNLPVTRTPDAHWMTEARYRGQKVVAVAPDYADNVKFADEWLPAAPGTDGALAMAMGHVVLKEFFVDRQAPYFTDYVKRYTDLPFLVRLERGGRRRVHRRASSSPPPTSPTHADEENAAFKTVLLDAAHRRAGRAERLARPPLRRGGRRAGGTSTSATSTRCSSLLGTADGVGRGRAAALRHPRRRGRATLPRGVPVRRVGGHLVTTVFDLLLAQYGVGRATGCPGDVADRLRRRRRAVHPGLAGGDHRRAGRDGRPDRPRVRRQRRGVRAAAR